MPSGDAKFRNNDGKACVFLQLRMLYHYFDSHDTCNECNPLDSEQVNGFTNKKSCCTYIATTPVNEEYQFLFLGEYSNPSLTWWEFLKDNDTSVFQNVKHNCCSGAPWDLGAVYCCPSKSVTYSMDLHVTLQNISRTGNSNQPLPSNTEFTVYADCCKDGSYNPHTASCTHTTGVYKGKTSQGSSLSSVSLTLSSSGVNNCSSPNLVRIDMRRGGGSNECPYLDAELYINNSADKYYHVKCLKCDDKVCRSDLLIRQSTLRKLSM